MILYPPFKFSKFIARKLFYVATFIFFAFLSPNESERHFESAFVLHHLHHLFALLVLLK